MKHTALNYRGYRFPPEIISHAVWLYHRSCLSLRDVADLLAERGITISYETIRDRCQAYEPDYARRLRRRLVSGGQRTHRAHPRGLMALEPGGTLGLYSVTAFRHLQNRRRRDGAGLSGHRRQARPPVAVKAAKESGASMHRVLLAVLVVIGALNAGCRASPPEIEDFDLDPRPNDRVPLAAQIAFRTNRPTTVALEFDDGERSWTVEIGGGATTNHVVPILGMRPDRTHVVRAVVTGEHGGTKRVGAV